MRFPDTAKAGWLVLAVALLLGACGGSRAPVRTVTATSRTVDIYSSLPLQGGLSTQASAIVNGIKLALLQAHGRAGRWEVNYRSLDDSSAQTGTWDATQTAANARTAAADPDVVYYIGELKGGTEVSLPILNQAGVPQISPGSTYVGLTAHLAGTGANEPGAYYPSGARTFLRLMPPDSVQAAADLMAMRQAHCRRVATISDGETYGAGLAAMVSAERAWYGIRVVSNQAIDPTATSFTSDAHRIRTEGADCLFFAGVASPAAVQVTEDVHAAVPDARIFGGDGVCTSSYTADGAGGVQAGIDSLIECTAATPNLSATPAGRVFLAAYRARYGVAHPDPYAVYGYEAMKLGLSTIAHLGTEGNSKSAVLKALFAAVEPNSPVGSVAFARDGDRTLRSYGLYRVSADGTPVFYKSLTPPRTLP